MRNLFEGFLDLLARLGWSSFLGSCHHLQDLAAALHWQFKVTRTVGDLVVDHGAVHSQ